MTVIDAGPLLGNWHEEGRPPADGTGTTPAQAAYDPGERRDDHGRWAGADTLTRHTRPDGTLAPGRAALHQQIIDGILAGRQPQAHPVATFFGGGPGSGKSRLAGPDGAATIDSDAIKAQLPEYRDMLAAGDPRAAQHVHEESSHIAAQAVRQAQARRLHYILDGTGDSDYAKLSAKVRQARERGYAVHGKYVTVDTGTAISRAAKRAEHTGRMVPASVIRETHASVSRTFAQAAAAHLFDRLELHDNNGAEARLIASGEGSRFAATDQAAYQRFLSKAAR